MNNDLLLTIFGLVSVFLPLGLYYLATRQNKAVSLVSCPVGFIGVGLLSPRSKAKVNYDFYLVHVSGFDCKCDCVVEVSDERMAEAKARCDFFKPIAEVKVVNGQVIGVKSLRFQNEKKSYPTDVSWRLRSIYVSICYFILGLVLAGFVLPMVMSLSSNGMTVLACIQSVLYVLCGYFVAPVRIAKGDVKNIKFGLFSVFSAILGKSYTAVHNVGQGRSAIWLLAALCFAALVALIYFNSALALIFGVWLALPLGIFLWCLGQNS